MKKIFSILTSVFMVSGTLSAIESIHELPYSGLILDRVDLKGVVIDDFHFENNHKLIHVHPRQVFKCHAHYSIDSSELESFHKYQIVIGLYDHGPIEKLATSYGLIDDVGSGFVELVAPQEKGVYEVRASLVKGLTLEDAKKNWKKSVSKETVLGIVIVE